ncbi:hypothetical protein T459_24247 [Capsicum annuum]|uniref:Disease resistance protein winged helix domain-containing protein n=1 Tax=Capsicum annuum TaxID=4072 RepID=A0A2G2YUP2_CAPAN|nr:hypothetical protein T459_24247 [Capsicum annuum]
MQMDLMDQDESWNLFKSAAFSSEALPYEFETVGKQIADECHGLPLTIVVVAGLLKYKRSIEDWRNVAKMSKDSGIAVKKLMRSWMAEGFLKLENDLEGEAEKCLQELVDRCLVLICKKSLDGTKIRSCKVHDLIYDLCMREIQRENIFIMNDIVFGNSDANHVPSECQSLMQMQPFKRVTGDEIDSSPCGLYRALLTPVHRQLRYHDNSNLLKRTLLELRHIEIDNFPVQILSLIWLRYLALLFRGEMFDIPPEISKLWNLQTFNVKGPNRSFVTCPMQIWGLMQLRYLTQPTFYLPDCPSGSFDKGRHLDFSKFQTISYLSPRCFTTEVIVGIQSVKELGICRYGNVTDFNGLLTNLVHLQQLETLSVIICCNLLPSSAKAFPATIKKLKLNSTYLSWSYLDIIGELPNLELLKLIDDACLGKEWHPNVKGFTRLKLLLIEDNRLKNWKATDDNFPILERLRIRSCYYLKEIPIEFADINTLQLIELRDCLPELEESSARIQKEQEDLGNNPVDVPELPNLEGLKLMCNACVDPEWYPSVRGFNKLKLSLIEFNDLMYWKATNDNFPVLERLMIRSCHHLKEIPIEFADINMLQLIQLKWCLPELGKSAARIQKEPEDLGNNPVDVCISDPFTDDEDDDDNDDDDEEE